MRSLALLLCCVITAAAHGAGPFRAGGPATTDNDASCDISLLPAATLLLPYFEVDLTVTGMGETTIFTLTNTSNLPQVARVTLWTDLGYPVLNFNVFLTGYDVQSINLYDVIRNGQIAPAAGTGFDVSPVGELSGNTARQITSDNPLLNERSCVDLPLQLPQVVVQRMQSAFTTGKVPALGSAPACNTAGGVHTNAVGYATIDVVGNCGTAMPTELGYYAEDIRFDNVLGGDYMQISGYEDQAQGGPMVHIRAIPEGGTARTRDDDPKYRVHLPRTFYSRFQHRATPLRDARQPLPSTFAARWISGGATGFETFFKIWREGRTSNATACSAYPERGRLGMVEMVLFDEEENPETYVPDYGGVCTPLINYPRLPLSSLTNVENSEVFPQNTEGAAAGWLYLNLDYCTQDTFGSQNWVVSSMRAEDRYSVDIDASALGNGCSAPTAASYATRDGGGPIGPAPNARP